MNTDTEDSLQRLAESQSQEIQRLRKTALHRDSEIDVLRKNVTVLEKDLAFHTAKHLNIVKWLRENAPEVYKRALEAQIHEG